MGFELRDHTADVAVAATGPSLESVFGSVADGLAAASCERVPETGGERFSLSVTAENLEALLFDYVDELIYLRDVRLELPVDHRVEDIAVARSDEPTADGESIDDAAYSLEATARGIPLSAVVAREIKAVTYSEMRLEETDDGWEAYVVFDV
ncbi:archease [Halostagnicola kamekurae]|uniref:SHS2 domain-containing protein n=1 Tax=Halostagnicola kamekurae TaxID=619731 RepID=A0A1I6QCD3_9EURY|nr:archease [Halostagnicola kamekurae]SFS50127.1 SHS2 domain-containing protein [Halostagnicola kamekurae]